MMSKRPLILISNDDGISAKGIKSLTEMLMPFGDIVVVAPDSAMSGKSSALTSEQVLRVKKLSEEPACTHYACSGTPTDCVKLAIDKLLDRKPDYVIAGINHGANSSTSVIYSGTIGAAIEGCMHDIPSIALSLCSHDEDADFMQYEPWISKIFTQVQQNSLPKQTLLNVNIPNAEVKGIKVCRQSFGIWQNEMEKRVDPRGRDYYWLTGDFANLEPEAKDTDLAALDEAYISIVPIKIDMTDYAALKQIKTWEF